MLYQLSYIPKGPAGQREGLYAPGFPPVKDKVCLPKPTKVAISLLASIGEGPMAVLPRLIALLSAVTLLAGCGGGSAPPTLGGAQAASNGGHAAEQISFIIPVAAAAGSSRRRNTLPSSTQSVVLAFSGPYGAALVPAVAPVTINTNTCTTISTGLQCTTTANLPVGSVVGSVAAYAGASGTGALLALGTFTLTVAPGATAAVTLTTSSNYEMFSGNSLSATLAVDHVADTFTVNTTNVTGGPVTLSGTIVPLANGDIKGTITNNGGSAADPIGDIVLFRELPNGAVMLEDSGNASPPSPWDGSTSTGGAGLGVANPSCATASGGFPIDLISLSGNGFTAAGSSPSQASIVGTATLTSTTLVGSGIAYDINGNSQGATTSGTISCSGNIYVPSSNNEPTLGFNNLGVIVGANGNGSNNLNPSVVGVAGFVNPASVSIPALISVSYDGFVVSGNGGTSNSTVQPFTATPISTGLQFCPYTDILNNVPATGTNCLTITVVSQPYPGLLYASLSNGKVAVLSVAQISGKYAIFGLADVGTNTTSGVAGNFVLFQH